MVRPRAQGRMESHGAETGGSSLTDVLTEFATAGYKGSFSAHAPGHLECGACGKWHEPGDLQFEAMRRIEGVTDPDDELAVAALECGTCHMLGIVVLPYGTRAGPVAGRILRELKATRPALEGIEFGDDSLVWDSGWLDHPTRR